MSRRKPSGLPVLLTRVKRAGARGVEVILAESSALEGVRARRIEGGRIHLQLVVEDAWSDYEYTLSIDAGHAGEMLLDARDAIARLTSGGVK